MTSLSPITAVIQLMWNFITCFLLCPRASALPYPTMKKNQQRQLWMELCNMKFWSVWKVIPRQSQHKIDLKNKRADCAKVSVLLNNVFFSNELFSVIKILNLVGYSSASTLEDLLSYYGSLQLLGWLGEILKSIQEWYLQKLCYSNFDSRVNIVCWWLAHSEPTDGHRSEQLGSFLL